MNPIKVNIPLHEGYKFNSWIDEEIKPKIVISKKDMTSSDYKTHNAFAKVSYKNDLPELHVENFNGRLNRLENKGIKAENFAPDVFFDKMLGGEKYTIVQLRHNIITNQMEVAVPEDFKIKHHELLQQNPRVAFRDDDGGMNYLSDRAPVEFTTLTHAEVKHMTSTVTKALSKYLETYKSIKQQMILEQASKEKAERSKEDSDLNKEMLEEHALNDKELLANLGSKGHKHHTVDDHIRGRLEKQKDRQIAATEQNNRSTIRERETAQFIRQQDAKHAKASDEKRREKELAQRQSTKDHVQKDNRRTDHFKNDTKKNP